MSKNNKKSMVPELRFPEFEINGEWEERNLNTYLELLTDFEANGSFADVKENVNIYDTPNYAWYVRATDLENETDLQGVKYVNKRSYDFLKKTSLFGGELLISKRGEIGKVFFFAPKENHPATVAPNLYLLKMTKNAVPKFFYYYFISPHGNQSLKRLDASSTIGALYKDDVKNIILRAPLLEEQQKIADCLSSLDEVIASEYQKLDIIKDHKKGLLQNLLPQEGETSPKFRFKEFENIGDWKETTLTQIADYQNGKAHEQDIADDGKYIVVNSKFISQDGEVKKFTNNAFCPATKGDVLMVLSDIPNGKAFAKCFIVEEENRYTVNQRICRISPRNFNSKILYYLLNRNPYFLSFNDGVKQTNLKKEDVLNCPLLIPSDPREQERIANTLSSIDDLLNAQIKKVEVLKRHKRGLLQGLFPDVNELTA